MKKKEEKRRRRSSAKAVGDGTAATGDGCRHSIHGWTPLETMNTTVVVVSRNSDEKWGIGEEKVARRSGHFRRQFEAFSVRADLGLSMDR